MQRKFRYWKTVVLFVIVASPMTVPITTDYDDL